MVAFSPTRLGYWCGVPPPRLLRQGVPRTPVYRRGLPFRLGGGNIPIPGLSPGSTVAVGPAGRGRWLGEDIVASCPARPSTRGATWGEASWPRVQAVPPRAMPWKRAHGGRGGLGRPPFCPRVVLCDSERADARALVGIDGVDGCGDSHHS